MSQQPFRTDVDVLELLTMHQLLKIIPNWIIRRVQIRWVRWPIWRFCRFNEKSGTFLCRKATLCIDLCNGAPSFWRVTTSSYLSQRIFNLVTQIFHWLLDSNHCRTFQCKSLHFTANGSKFMMGQNLCVFSGTPCTFWDRNHGTLQWCIKSSLSKVS